MSYGCDVTAATFAGAAIAIIVTRTRNVVGSGMQAGWPKRSFVVAGSGGARHVTFNRSRMRSFDRLWSWTRTERNEY